MIQQAENGNVDAMTILADAYIEGTVLHFDPYEACRWWTEAANAGHIGSMYNLGILYRGDIVSYFYDDDKAFYWLKRAGENGDVEAQSLFNQTYKYSHFLQKWVHR